MQSFAIAYERFHMDPMKRGLVNQLSTTYMTFAMCFSITRIFRYLLEWLAPQSLPNFLFKYYSALVGWLGWSSTFGCLITTNEVIFFTYWSKMWLKRVPNYNHDFLGVWLNTTNVTIASYLASLKAFSSIEWAKHEDNLPRVKIFLYLGSMIVFQALVYMVHNLIDCFKTRKPNSILPIMNEQVFSVPMPKEQPQPQPNLAAMLNTTKYNPDLLNWKVAMAVISIIPLLLYCHYIIKLKYAPIHFIHTIVQCFYVPLIVCSFNLKLRSFILAHFASHNNWNYFQAPSFLVGRFQSKDVAMMVIYNTCITRHRQKLSRKPLLECTTQQYRVNGK